MLHRLRSFSIPVETDVEAAPVQDGGELETSYFPPEIKTLYSVSARVEPVFLDANKRCVFCEERWSVSQSLTSPRGDKNILISLNVKLLPALPPVALPPVLFSSD